MKLCPLSLLFLLALAAAAGGQTPGSDLYLSAFERQFAGGDPMRRYFFRDYFSTPNVERTFKQLTAGSPAPR